MSLGLAQGPGSDCGTSGVFPLRQAVCGVTSRGIPVVVAAGNLATNANNYSPASYPEVTSVSAYTDTNGRTGGGGASCSGGDDEFATYSNFNADIMAPGSCITSTAPGGGTAVKSGTSMASPLVAGAIGLYGSLAGITVPRSDLRGAVTGGDPVVLYVGNGTIPGGGGTPTATATATRAATATATRAATATATSTATLRLRSTSTPQPGTATAMATTRSATATPTATARPGTATPTPTSPPATVTAAATATPGRTSTRPSRATATPVVMSQAVTEFATSTVPVQATATRAATAVLTGRPTRSPRVVNQATAPSTETPVVVTSTATPTLVPSDVPTEIGIEDQTLAPTETPTGVTTEEPTLAPTEVPTEIPTEIPTEEPTHVATGEPTIDPAVVSDTFFTGTAWYAADGDPLTTWYMDVPSPVLMEEAPVAPVDETGEVPVDGGDGTGEISTDIPVEVIVEPMAEPEHFALVIDLGYVQTVGNVRWQWTETTYAHGAEVQVSLDGETWTTVAYPDTYNAIPGEWQEIPLGIDTQYVRFLFPNAEELPVVGGLSEVEVLPVPAL